MSQIILSIWFYNTKVISMVRILPLLVPRIKELGWGRIIQISSGAAISPPPRMPDYSATKAASITMTVSRANYWPRRKYETLSTLLVSVLTGRKTSVYPVLSRM